jgi:hypothetical protein
MDRGSSALAPPFAKYVHNRGWLLKACSLRETAARQERIVVQARASA